MRLVQKSPVRSVLSGLTAGQRIVVMGANLLQPGDPVKEVE
jgi:hypothetical protein